MAVAHRATGVIVHGTTSAAPAYPAGIFADDGVWLFAAASSSDVVTFPTISGWTKEAEATLGGGVIGVGTGPRRLARYRKDSVAGGESGTVTVTPTGGSNVCSGVITAWSVASGKVFNVQAEQGQDDTAGTAMRIDAGSVMDVVGGDFLVGMIAAPANVNLASQTFAVTGTVLGTAVEHADTGTTNGDNNRISVMSRDVTSGTGSAAPQYQTSATGTGGAFILRLREAEPPGGTTRAHVTSYSFDAASDSRAVTIPADCEVLEVSVCTVAGGLDQSGVTCNGVALTKLGTGVHSGGKPRVSVWRLIAPATGSQTIVVTLSGGADKTAVAVNSWTAIDTTTPFEGLVSANGTSTTPASASVTSATGDLVADSGGSISPLAYSPTGGNTELFDLAVVAAGRMFGSTEAGAATVTTSWSSDTADSKEWVVVAWNANAGGIPQQVTLTAATETDSAQALSFTQTGPITLTPATETDTAQALSIGERRAVVSWAQLEIPPAGEPPPGLQLTPATETETAVALSITHVHFRDLIPVAEADSAVALNIDKSTTVTLAAETDTAVVLDADKAGSLTPAAETDAAVALSKTKTPALTSATEAETAQALDTDKTVTLVPAAETDAAVAVTYSQAGAVTLSPVLEIDGAQALSVTKTIFVSLTPASETDSAQALNIDKTLSVAPTTETDAAVALAVVKTIFKAPTPATEVDAAQALTRQKQVTLVVASETDTAQVANVDKTVTLSPAVETDTAVALTITGLDKTLIPATEIDVAMVLGWAMVGRSIDHDQFITAGIESDFGLVGAVESRQQLVGAID